MSGSISPPQLETLINVRSGVWVLLSSLLLIIWIPSIEFFLPSKDRGVVDR